MLKRLFFILLILVFNLLPNYAEVQTKGIENVKGLNINAMTKVNNKIKESYKINGQIEYDDNLIETIYLEEDIDKPEVNIPQRTLIMPINRLNITSNSNTNRSALARSMVNRSGLGDILPLNASIAASNGGFTYGSRFGEELSYSQIESTAAFFLRYDSKHHYSFETALRESANRELEDSQWSSLRITPEWHITDRLTLKNTFTNYLQSQKNKNELIIVYTPKLKKYADSLKFELGIAQSYYSNGNKSESVSFSTGFRI